MNDLVISFLIVVVTLGIGVAAGEVWRRHQPPVARPRSPSVLLEPVCRDCQRADEEPYWRPDLLFCVRCQKVTTKYRALVRGPKLEARS